MEPFLEEAKKLGEKDGVEASLILFTTWLTN
jgi:hypothetical protein